MSTLPEYVDRGWRVKSRQRDRNREATGSDQWLSLKDKLKKDVVIIAALVITSRIINRQAHRNQLNLLITYIPNQPKTFCEKRLA